MASDKRQETVADVVAEMRGYEDAMRTRYKEAVEGDKYLSCDVMALRINGYANRLEAAWKRERVEIATKAAGQAVNLTNEKYRNTPVGNAAAMREALVRVRGWLERMNKERLDAFAESQITPAYAVNRQAKTIIEDNEYHIGQINAALAAPPRNCDVGTAEEQAERFRRHCDKFTRDGMHETCPCCGKIPFAGCEFAWEQMPYEAKKGGAE